MHIDDDTWLKKLLCITLMVDNSPALLDLFISSDGSICSTMTFPPLGNSDHAAVSISIDFPSNSQRDAPFHRIAYDYPVLIWMVFVII